MRGNDPVARVTSLNRWRVWRRFRTRKRTSVRSNGLARKSSAPRRRALFRATVRSSAGEHDHWQKAQRSASAPEAAQNLQAVWLGHVQVQHEQVGLEVGEGLLGRLRVSYAADFIGDIGKKALDQLDVGGLVVHD